MGKGLIAGVILCLLAAFWMRSTKVTVTVPAEKWWCPENEGKTDTSVKPFKITFPDEMVKDLKRRLNNTRKLTESLLDTEWSYGVGGSKFKGVLDHWLNKYDFKAREARLNKYPQFITNIQGLDIHFLHVKPENPGNKRVVPLLLVHGWPGSVVEFYKMIPLLTTPRSGQDFVFEVIAPSLPGYAYSSAATIPGLGAKEIAVVLKNLMLRLGYKSWYVQGGDWGAVITGHMAAVYPEHVRALHSNMCTLISTRSTLLTVLFSFFPSLITTEETYHLMYPLKKHWSMLLRESGYFHIQATKPDTIGVGLSDSPAGMAAYILEKFQVWTDDDGLVKANERINDKFELDELIDNLMMYWAPNKFTTAARIYAETANARNEGLGFAGYPINVPSYCAQFPKEIAYQPKFILREKYPDLRRATLMPRGGHFAAMEEPELLANDIWESFAEIENPPRDNSKS